MDTKDKIEWRIEYSEKINGLNRFDIFVFRKYVNDKIKESYRPVNKEEAIVFFTCISNGFEPPKKW